MDRRSTLLMVTVLFGLAFSQQALSESKNVRLEFEPGISKTQNVSSISREMVIDGAPHDLVPITGLLGQSVNYAFESKADSADGPAESSVFGVFFTADNDSPESLKMDVSYSATLSATGNTAWANSQIHLSCVLLCIVVQESLTLLPAELQSAYNAALQVAGGTPNTLRALETLLTTTDTDFGNSVFSALTGKIDVGLPGLFVALSVILAPGGRFAASLDTGANAIESTAIANGQFSLSVSAVPEPATHLMLLVGLGLLVYLARGRIGKPQALR